jgi:hypothetical protein
MTRAEQRSLAYSMLSTTFVTLCVNIVIFEQNRSPLSIIGILIAALATIISAVVTVLSRRRIESE